MPLPIVAVAFAANVARLVSLLRTLSIAARAAAIAMRRVARQTAEAQRARVIVKVKPVGFDKVSRSLGRLEDDIRNRALVSAINKTAAKAQTEMSRRIRDEYNVRAARVREALRISRAYRGKLSAELRAQLPSGRRSANLIRYEAKQAKRTRQTTARIKKGARKVIGGGAFIANNGRTVFRRVGDKRLPIEPVQTIDIPQMFNQRTINAEVVAFIEREFPRIFENELRFYIAKFNRGGY